MKLTKKYSLLSIAALVVVLLFGAMVYLRSSHFLADSASSSAVINGTIDKTSLNTRNESLGLSWDTKQNADVRVYVRKPVANGASIATIFIENGQKAGSYKSWWNGVDNNKILLPVGSYQIVFEAYVKSTGRTYRTFFDFKITNDSSTPSAIPSDTDTSDTPDTSSDTPVITADSELGFVAEGSARSNFDYWKNGNNTKFGAAFKAAKSGNVTRFALAWKTYEAGQYGKKPYGTWSFELRANGSDNFPGTSVLGKVAGIVPPSSADNSNGDWMYIPISARLEAGKIYHLIAQNTGSGYSSINTIQSRVLPWPQGIDTTPRAECFDCYGSGAKWNPWGSKWSEWATSDDNLVNSSIVPLITEWQDGSATGFPYTSNATSDSVSSFGGTKIGEYITWKNNDTTISSLGILAGGSGTITYTLETTSGQKISSGKLNGSSKNSPEWYTATVTGVTLKKGQSYRLWFAGTGSMYSYPFYDPQGNKYESIGFGGADSYYIDANGQKAGGGYNNIDLPISLKK